MLELAKMSGGYGSGDILTDIDLTLQPGEQVALIGPNGAGKSSLMAAIMATLPYRRGTLRLDARDLTRAATHGVVAAGLALVPEGRQIFVPFSVRDNLRLGAIALAGRDDLAARFRYVFDLFPALAARAEQRAGTMSGGEQQMLAIARALMSRPGTLLLDEPFVGLAPKIVEDITRALGKLREDGLTILLVEQKLDIVLASTTRVYVMLKGRIVLEETTAALARRPDLHELYFSLAAAGGGDIDPPAPRT
jgi:branched-chain amino acid transport system ATP-binding protein